MSAVNQIVGVRLDAPADSRELDALREQLLRAQPQSEPLLKRLLARSHRAFARIHAGRCSACNVTIATARLQRAQAGEFINCANCMVFLYGMDQTKESPPE